MATRSEAALKAWETRRTATYRARRTAKRSQVALQLWARENRWHLIFLDAPSGAPRTGIVDALLVRVRRGEADCLETRLVQLKGGGAGLTAAERRRLRAACEAMCCAPAYAYFDGDDLEVELPALQKRKSGSTRTA